MDNQIHPYGKGHAAKLFLLEDNATLEQSPIITRNNQNSYSIIYSHLQELMETAVQLSKKTHKKIDLINITAHGFPGGLWFPKDKKTLESSECKDWVESSTNSDQKNYDMYYSPVSKESFKSIRAFSNIVDDTDYECTIGHRQWNEILNLVPEFKTSLSQKAQIHFLSCTVGLGPRGKVFNESIAKSTFTSKSQTIQTSLQLGLLDWSMPDGMGFWDYLTDSQLDYDNSRYPIDRCDANMKQKGNLRVTHLEQGQTISGISQPLDVMLTSYDSRPLNLQAEQSLENVTTQDVISFDVIDFTIPRTEVRLFTIKK
jgi:hypothetical protein